MKIETVRTSNIQHRTLNFEVGKGAFMNTGLESPVNRQAGKPALRAVGGAGARQVRGAEGGLAVAALWQGWVGKYEAW